MLKSRSKAAKIEPKESPIININQSFEDSSEMKIEQEEISNPVITFICDICGKVSASQLNLDRHKRMAHSKQHSKVRKKSKSSKFYEKKLNCKICGYTSLKANNFNRHMEKHERNENKFVDNENSVRCEICNLLISHKHRLSHHMKIVHPKETIKCEICGVEFKAKQTWLRHVKKFHLIKSEAKVKSEIKEENSKVEIKIEIKQEPEVILDDYN